jgi:hypothetical protein
MKAQIYISKKGNKVQPGNRIMQTYLRVELLRAEENKTKP